jgi:regulator of PEP synthase PpsR (kinase-PPPase family)
MDQTERAIVKLEEANQALVDGRPEALALREVAIRRLAGLTVNEAQLQRIERLAAAGLAGLERVRSQRAAILKEIQEAAAARHFAAALTGRAGAPVVDVQG